MRGDGPATSIVRVGMGGHTAARVPWYFVCARCNAKWFHSTEVVNCPRCGALCRSHEQITPPWCSGGRESAERLEQGEQRGAGKNPAAVHPRRYLFHHAMEYRERGWSVIPLNGESPAIERVEYSRRRPHLGEIATWFGFGSGQTMNIGIITGVISGLVVVSCKSGQALAWWLSHAQPTPLVAMTGTKGFDLYYRWSDIPRDGIDLQPLAGAIEVLGNGRYAIAPPSVHPQTGVACEWSDDGGYSLDAVPFFEASWVAGQQKGCPATATES